MQAMFVEPQQSLLERLMKHRNKLAARPEPSPRLATRGLAESV